MMGLSALGVGQTLKNANIAVQGHIEGGYTWNFNDPSGNVNEGRAFDYLHNRALLNQLDINVTRTAATDKFDIGGMVEFIYGSDSKFIHSNGLFDWHNNDVSPPRNQWDLTQAYLTFNIPMGPDHNLVLEAGKFVTLLGQEYINPTSNALYSHSFLFTYAIPFTHTGVLATYNLSKEVTIEGGITRGWEQSTKDNNGSIDVTGEIKWTKDAWGVIFNFITGPEQAHDSSHYRTVLDGIVTYKLNDAWNFAVNADYGFESSVPGIGDTAWYGVAAYGQYIINDNLTANARVEWFRDQDGSRVGIEDHLFEATLGVTYKPFAADPASTIKTLLSNFSIRPEIRYDYSTHPFFDGGSRRNQFTFGVDAIFTL